MRAIVKSMVRSKSQRILKKYIIMLFLVGYF
jgi:hypothetical protein